ncbi:unnamed protein product [Auanema sp. JU1783]|nr:unnamed protein product [Auanema sp. JU1783]
MSANEGGHQDNTNAGTTPTLNTLLSSKPASGGDIASPSHPSQDGMHNGSTPKVHPQVAGVQNQEWQQPRSPSQAGGDVSQQTQGMPPQPPPQGYQPPQGYPPHPYMVQRPGVHPGYPGYPSGYHAPPPQGYSTYPPQMMRPGGPPQQNDFVRMPPGPSPMDWSAQQKKMMETPTNASTPASNMPAPSPAPSSIADESMDEKSRMESPSWQNHSQQQRPMQGPPSGPPQPMPGGMHQGMMPPGHPGMPPQHPNMHPGMMQPPVMSPAVMQRKDSIVDKLVGPATAANPPRVMPERRAFFERLVAFCEQHCEPITMVPQVSKQNVDLHRLYIAVRNRGGFEQVTKEKAWKNVCAEANPEISESSAAGYQLRKHYQKYLLLLECVETGKNADEAVAFADKLKRQRRKEPAAASQTPTFGGGQPGQAGPPPNAQPHPGGPPQGSMPQPGAYPPPPGHPGMESHPYYHQPGYGPPPGYPGAPPPGHYPGAPYQRMPPGVTPMRAPHPQQHMGPPMQAQQQLPQQPPLQAPPPAQSTPSSEAEQQQQSLQVPAQCSQPATPSSHAGPSSVQPATPQAAQPDNAGSQNGSRAPSAGPPPSAATPDSSSRMSAGGEGTEQPEAAQPSGGSGNATPIPPAHTTQPSTSSSAAPAVSSSAPPQPAQSHPSPNPASMMQPAASGTPGGPPGGPHGQYYGQPPPMYPSGGPPRPGVPPGYPGYPGNPPYHPGHPGGHYNSHPAAHPSHPHHQQYMQQQQQMWQQRYPNQPPPGSNTQPMQRGFGYPRMPQPSAPSPGGQKMRHPQQPMPNPATPSAPAPPAVHAASPAPSHRPGPPGPPGYPQTGLPVQPAPSSSQLHTFPPGSIEATTICQKRRRKILARELINATPKRLVMALRSGLETEAIWAINALNVLLYDDSNPHPTLAQMPSILNVIIEHFWATLSLLYPDTFPLSEPNRKQVFADGILSEDMKTIIASSTRTDVKHLVNVKNADKKINYTKQTRNGRKVQVKETEMPESLKRRIMLEESTSVDVDESLTTTYVEERSKIGLGGGLAERIAARLRSEWEASQAEPSPRFSLYPRNKESTDAVVPNDVSIKQEVPDDDEEVPEILLLRRSKKIELSDIPIEFELRWPRHSALSDRDDFFYRLAMRALALSNIIRGFSFITGNENVLCKHNGVLFMIGRFLSLKAQEVRVSRIKPTKTEAEAPLPERESFEVSRAKSIAVLENDDNRELLLVETAQQLRDDAFVMLCHMSATLDLFDVDDSLSYPIYDGLLRWSVSSVPEAIDPIPPAATSVRNYCLEIICKMSVLERNVDMLTVTGPFPRLEKFAHVLTKLINLSEEAHNREFAIVILNALCNASEAICFVTAHQTQVISHLIGFIEHADQTMHQVMQNHGIAALRENPELMGTSVGMLRRAATILRNLIKVPEAYKYYLKHQQKLLQFTMSQLMDSRVAGMFADILYEIQGALSKIDVARKPVSSSKTEEKDCKKVSVKAEPEEEVSDVSADNADSGNEKPAINGDTHVVPVAQVAKGGKRGTSRDESPPSKRSCLENGFGDKKNGIIEKSTLQIKETRSDNGSMAVVA